MLSAAAEPRDPEDRLVRRYAERYLPARGFSDVLVIAQAGHDWTLFLCERGYDVTVTALDARDLDAAAETRLEGCGGAVAFLAPDVAFEAVYSAVLCPARALMDASDPCRLAARLAGALRSDGHLVAGALLDDAYTARHPCLAPARLGLQVADPRKWGGTGALRPA